MDVQVEKTGSYLCKLSIGIPATDVDAAFDQALRKVTKGAQIPGFRAGKAPRGILERQFAPQIEQEVQTQLVESTLFTALEQHEIIPVSMPRVDLGKLQRGAVFEFKAEVEVRPDITLQSYQDLTAPSVDTAVADETIDAEIETMRKQAAQLVPVLLRDTVQEGDVVQIDYEGTQGGEPFEGGKAENALIEIGANDYIPGFAEGLVGAKVPGERTLAVSFPADYSVEDLASKEASFAVRLKELKARELPALDDEFAKDMGHDSLQALRDEIRDRLVAKKTDEADGKRRRAVVEQLIAKNPFDVPPSMVDTQTDTIVRRAAARVERMMGQRFDLGAEALNNLRASSRVDAEFQVRSALILLAIAKAEKIEISREELQVEVDKMAIEAGDAADEVRQYFANPDRRAELEFSRLEDKVLRFLLENAKPVPADESPAAASA